MPSKLNEAFKALQSFQGSTLFPKALQSLLSFIKLSKLYTTLRALRSFQTYTIYLKFYTAFKPWNFLSFLNLKISNKVSFLKKNWNVKFINFSHQICINPFRKVHLNCFLSVSSRWTSRRRNNSKFIQLRCTQWLAKF